MKRALILPLIIPAIIILLLNLRSTDDFQKESETADNLHTVADIIQPGETMEQIFNKHGLNMTELSEIVQGSRAQYNLSRLSVGNTYIFQVDDNQSIQNMQYIIDDLSFLDVKRLPEGFLIEKKEVSYERRIGSLNISIKNNLASSMPDTHSEYSRIALKLSDIYAWDIDFLSDIRNGDSVKIILEELWAGNAFKGYGDIIASEFINNGKSHKAYRFENEEFSDYYDAEGKSLRKTLLRSPLKFSRISSYFSKNRLHPILRIYRPHLGVDYSAAAGTPVSAAGDGKVVFAGYKGQYGKMVKIKHRGGFETFYGHLSRIPRHMKRGRQVSQDDIIGYIGETGLATGPHLDYRIKLNGRFVNPLKVVLPHGKSIPENMIADFKKLTHSVNIMLSSLPRPVLALSGNNEATRL
jgi:murein DD-endopeptidase MepM/ murein hydrolase activator NlpD